MTRLNIGCGRTPTLGWKNYDNSWSVRLAKRPLLTWALRKTRLLNEQQRKFIVAAKESSIQWADATKRIPEPDGSVEVLYSSHMLEHLNRKQAIAFLKEVRRVLQSGGIIRLAVPDIHYHVNNYLQHHDADRFMEETYLTHGSQGGHNTFWKKLTFLFVGERHHQWMYDGKSLCNFLSSVGFKDARVMEAGTTGIPDSGALDLRERSPESVFVEAINP